MLSKFYSVLIGIVIALTMLGLVVAGVTKVRMSRQAVMPEVVTDVAPAATLPVAEVPVVEAPVVANPGDADTGIAIKGSVGTEVKVEEPKVRDITMLAKNFKFEPSQVKVKKGEKVTITVKSAEGVHNLFIGGYDVRSDVKGMSESATVSFVADKIGTFDMWCEVGSHKALGMTGKLIVE